MNIGSAIKSIRKKLSITQYELAEKCDLSQTSLSQIETGVKRPSQRTISKVCAVLDIPESIIYIVAMQEADVPASKRGVYDLVYPSIKSLALQMVSSEHLSWCRRWLDQYLIPFVHYYLTGPSGRLFF